MHLVYGHQHICGGSFSESFALPLICIGMFLYTKYMFKDTNISNINIILFGILTGLIAQLRLNMLSYFLAMFITIGILLIKNKEFKEILRWILWGVTGFIISLIPSLIYLIKNGILMDCINTAYLDVLGGFAAGGIADRLGALKTMIDVTNISGVMFLILGFLIISVVLINLNKIKDFKEQLYIMAVILSIVINLYANSVSGAVHMHYFLTFIPVAVMVTGLAIKLYDKIKIDKNNFKVPLLTILVVLLTAVSYESYINHYIKAFMTPVHPQSLYVKITEYITNNTNEDDLVQFIGGREEAVSANFRSQRLSASNYSYLPLWDTFTKERKAIIVNDVLEDIYSTTPKLMFVCLTNQEEFDGLIENKQLWDNYLEENYIKDTKAIYNYVLYIRK